MEIDKLTYKLIDECKCGFEELFNLIGFIDYSDNTQIDQFIKQLVCLCNKGFIECKFSTKIIKKLTANQLKTHIQVRIDKGEDLESYPDDGKEFSFYTTEKALNFLTDKDMPQ